MSIQVKVLRTVKRGQDYTNAGDIISISKQELEANADLYRSLDEEARMEAEKQAIPNPQTVHAWHYEMKAKLQEEERRRQQVEAELAALRAEEQIRVAQELRKRIEEEKARAEEEGLAKEAVLETESGKPKAKKQ